MLRGYVDESGDRGTSPTATDFFVMSAIVVPRSSRAAQLLRASRFTSPTAGSWVVCCRTDAHRLPSAPVGAPSRSRRRLSRSSGTTLSSRRWPSRRTFESRLDESCSSAMAGGRRASRRPPGGADAWAQVRPSASSEVRAQAAVRDLGEGARRAHANGTGHHPLRALFLALRGSAA
jgi:hypothetical protein